MSPSHRTVVSMRNNIQSLIDSIAYSEEICPSAACKLLIEEALIQRGWDVCKSKPTRKQWKEPPPPPQVKRMISLPMTPTYSINDYAHSFTTFKRDDGSTIIKHEEGTPDFYIKVTYEAHHNELPDDWVYETCSHCADELNSGERDFYAISERACDPYTSQLINWLPGNTQWFDDAISELRDQGGTLTFWSVATEAQRMKAMQILCTIAQHFEIEPE